MTKFVLWIKSLFGKKEKKKPTSLIGLPVSKALEVIDEWDRETRERSLYLVPIILADIRSDLLNMHLPEGKSIDKFDLYPQLMTYRESELKRFNLKKEADKEDEAYEDSLRMKV